MVAFYNLVTCCLITVPVSTDAYHEQFYSLQFCYQTKEVELNFTLSSSPWQLKQQLCRMAYIIKMFRFLVY